MAGDRLMNPDRLPPIRPKPTGPVRYFVIYQRETGSILGVHQMLSYATKRSDAILTPEKQQAAEQATQVAAVQRVAAAAGVPVDQLETLQVKEAHAGQLAHMRVDPKRHRLVRKPGVPKHGLSALNAAAAGKPT
jgi:hypothetical protein